MIDLDIMEEEKSIERSVEKQAVIVEINYDSVN